MITVSFNCENHDHALLLVTLYDILTVKDIEDSTAAMENSGWLIDEIGSRLNDIDQFDIGYEDDHNLIGMALEVAKIYNHGKEIK